MARRAVVGSDDYSDTASELFPTVQGPFGAAMVQLGRRRDEVVALPADLTKWTDLAPFRDGRPIKVPGSSCGPISETFNAS